MQNYLMFIVGTGISCFINAIILYQFIEERNERIYNNRPLYDILKIVICLLIAVINLLQNPVLNIMSWLLLISIFYLVMYRNMNKKYIQRIIEIPSLILLLTISETVGVVILEFIFWKTRIDTIDSMIIYGLNVTFSKLVVLIVYNFGISRLWKSENTAKKLTSNEILIQTIIILYSAANLSVIVLTISQVSIVTDRILLLMNMGCILAADLYFLYFYKFAQENNQLKFKLDLLEQQSLIQYEYYTAQEDKYYESVKILHDVNKHLKVLEDIYKTKEDKLATVYTKEIGQILLPLVVQEYTNHPILNIILNDKKKCAQHNGIRFDLEIGAVNLNFMEAMEITTVFGNLLDNAIEACERVTGDKYIEMKLDSYNDFIAVKVSNSSQPIKEWSIGKPISKKGKNHGIGLINVENIIKKYDGSILLEEEKGKFVCSIIFNS